MAVKGPKGPRAPPTPAAPDRPAESAAPEAAPNHPLFPPMGEGRDQPQRDQAAAELSGEGRIGDPTVDPEVFAAMGSLIQARHLMTLLAARRSERSSLLTEVADLLMSLQDPKAIRRILLQMPEVGRIVDIYPLEVLDEILRRSPDLLPGFEYGPVILNKPELEAGDFEIGELIHIKVPLSLRMRAFALSGGGTPGYCLAPGPPAEYHLEMGDAGRFTLLVRGEVRKKSIVDRAILRITGAPES